MASFSKQMRITNETQLQTLFDSGKSISSGGITLKYIRSKTEFKVGFSENDCTQQQLQETYSNEECANPFGCKSIYSMILSLE